MATHSSVLAWRLSGMGEPWGLPSMGSQSQTRLKRLSSSSRSWIIEKAREFQKNICFCFLDYTKAFDCVDYNKPWKILQEMEIPGHLTCLLRSLYAGQEAIVRTRQGKPDWFKTGKGVHQGYILSPCLLPYTQSTSCDMLGWMNHKLESRLLGEILMTSDMQMTTLLWHKKRGTTEPLDENKRGE